jgi:hypothetical protein
MVKIELARALHGGRAMYDGRVHLIAQWRFHRGRRFHGFTQAEICKIIGGDYYDESR